MIGPDTQSVKAMLVDAIKNSFAISGQAHLIGATPSFIGIVDETGYGAPLIDADRLAATVAAWFAGWIDDRFITEDDVCLGSLDDLGITGGDQ